jgi:lipid-A-disaccharide synthase
MKYFFLAGEASGDLHGSNLASALFKQDASASMAGWGGEKMTTAGVQVHKHYKELAFMGFAEVVKNLGTILKNFKLCKQHITAFAPDVLILIDYPGFNLRMAKWAKQKGYKVAYYISPQVWAWKEGRVKAIKKYVDEMLVILPFEKAFYEKWNYPVHYVGHPLVKVIANFKKQQPVQAALAKPIVAVLPGSRRQEIAVKLPVMLGVAAAFTACDFVVAMAPGMDEAFYKPYLNKYPNVRAVSGSTYALLSQASAAIVTSGTATLETALFGVPEVICYKGSAISYAIAKRVITIKYICLVNLIMDRPVVKELIQQELTVANISNELQALLYNPQRRAALAQDYTALTELLSQGGDASANAAAIIYKLGTTTAH